jgi:hypothetical protein
MQNPGDEGAMRARRLTGIGARRGQFARDFADIFCGEIGVIERDRPIDEPDRNFRPPARARHQRA